MLKRALITLGASAVVLTAGAGVANAQGTNVSPLLPASQQVSASDAFHHPDLVQPAPYTGPAAPEHRIATGGQDAGAWGMGLLGLIALGFLL